MPSFTEAAHLRAAIAREQTRHWKRLVWEPARTKKELDRRETLWFWWGSIGWQAELAARGVTISNKRSFANER